MLQLLPSLLLSGLGAQALSIPRNTQDTQSITRRQSTIVDPLLVNRTSAPFTLPQDSTDPTTRALLIEYVRETFQYGPSVAGGPAFPNGTLGVAKYTADLDLIEEEAADETTNLETDAEEATEDAAEYDGLETLADYVKLYDDQWELIIPKGPAPGMLTNYTQDLLFSMERLSFSPYSVRRLDPSTDSLAFTVSDTVATQVADATLTELFDAGRLFYVDYSDQANLTLNSGRYSAAVDAYFYISPTSGDFLPLAIHSNVGSELVYTPADTAKDWLLAKIMFNVNDIWFSQWHHLAATHEVVQISWMAAIRTLSVEHPVFNILDRLMYEVFGIQQLAEDILFDTDGAVDEVFAFTGSDGESYSSNLYFNSGAGSVANNYFLVDLENRGLINSDVGPALKHFPFYHDGSVIHTAQNVFMTAFVDSYYSSNAEILADTELQAWVAEAQGPAAVIGFPSIKTRAALIRLLTHFAHLTTTAHHAINTNQLMTTASVLPFHPSAIYAPVPTAKGVTNITQFLPDLTKAIEEFEVDSDFARPLLVGTTRSLIYQFDDAATLNLTNAATVAANAEFMTTMKAFSATVAARTFGPKGLSQGMPFVWKALDPNVAPYGVTI